MFCEKCGNELIDNKCSKCGFVKYYNSIPVAVALIPVIDNQIVKILAIKRNIEPKKGYFALPGGFQEVEDIHSSLEREVLEEAGLSVKIDPNFDQLVLSSNPIPNRTLIFFVCKEVNKEEINFDFKDSNNEVSEIALIDQFSSLAFPLHEQAVKWYYSKLENKK